MCADLPSNLALTRLNVSRCRIDDAALVAIFRAGFNALGIMHADEIPPLTDAMLEPLRDAACCPALCSARSAALGIGCVELLKLPLQRVPRLGPLDHGDWPLPERRFVACPKVGAYLAARKKADAAVEAAFAVIGSRVLVEDRRAFLRAHAPRAPGDAIYEMRTDPEGAIVNDLLGQ